MSWKTAAVVALAAVCLLPDTARCGDQPTSQSLIDAWEGIQRNDPHTKVFQKLSDRRYRFQTDWFPYDGELLVLNTVLAPPPAGIEGPWGRMTTGTVEVDLPALTKDQRENLSHGIEIWERSNTLHYDPAAQRWLTSAEFQKQMMATAKRSLGAWPWLGILSGNVIPLALIVFLVWVWVSTSRRSKSLMSQMDESRRNVKTSLEQQARMIQLLEQVVALLEGQREK